MATKKTYKLCGYIEYIPLSTGFVTPVFAGVGDGYYVQFSSKDQKESELDLLPKEYHDFVIPADKNVFPGKAILYGFKWDADVFFAPGKEMADYLKTSFLPKAKEGRELADGFIKDWSLLEHNEHILTKEEVWANCIRFVNEVSRVLPKVFLENLQPISFENNVLALQSKSESIKEVFERNFKNILIAHFKQQIPNFEIEIESDRSITLPSLPFVQFHDNILINTQASFILETRINSFQDFESFLVTRRNTEAVQHALEFTKNKLSSILIVHGEAGVGKSHLIHSIANSHIKSGSDKVGVYRVLSSAEKSDKIIEEEIQRFEIIASNNDIIIIDDVQNLEEEKSSLRKVIKLLKYWRTLGKKIVLSFREQNEINWLPRLESAFEDISLKHIYLNQLDYEDKLTFIKFKASSHDLDFLNKEILTFLKNDYVKSFADMQSCLTRSYIVNNLKWRYKGLIYLHVDGHFDLRNLEWNVENYFRSNKDYSKIPKDLAEIYVNLITHFIYDSLTEPKNKGFIDFSQIRFRNLYVHSHDIFQHYFFENEEFRTAIIQIIKDSLLDNDRKSF